MDLILHQLFTNINQPIQQSNHLPVTLHGVISIILTEEKINLYDLNKNYSICINRYFIIITGYLIPKGWRIYVYTREINYDTSLYEDPMIFNPWRWMVSICNTQFFCALVFCSLKTFGSHREFLWIFKYAGKELGNKELFLTLWRWSKTLPWKGTRNL